MADLEILNANAHGGLRVASASSDSRHFVPLVVAEFESAAARFPILFCKAAETGAFYAGVVLGFKPGESIIRDSPDAMDANQLFDVVREGFYIVQDDIAIDRASMRLTSTSGAPLFEDGDRPAPALRRVQRALSELHAGLPQTEAFLERLLTLKLIEPIDLSFNFDDGERLELDGLYTISRDALADLDDGTALDLFRRGDLAHIYAAIGSLRHIPRLARLRNDRLVDA